MKITCERCSAQYDLDENRIPASGMSMKCPACLHQFTVRRSSANVPQMPKPPAPPVTAPPPKPKPREIELSTFGADEGPTPLPDAAPGMVAPDADEIDLPAPKSPSSSSLPRIQPVLADLPAPKAASRAPAIPPPKSPAIPPPKPPAIPRPSAPPAIDVEPTVDDSALSINRQSGPGPDEIDLPAPIDPARRHDVIDLPAPKATPPSGPQPRAVALADDDADLVAPKDRAPQVGISLDAPDPEDLVAATGTLGDDVGPPALELDTIDVVAPKLETAELPAPKAETMDVAPKAETVDVAPKAAIARTDVRPAAATATAATASAATATAVAKAKAKAAPAEKAKRRWPRVALAVGGVVVLLGGVGVALGVFTGFGQELLHRGHGGAELEQQLMGARKAMADDTLSSYRKAALALQPLVEADPNAFEAAALAAQARLGAAHLGQTSELKNADALLAKLTDDKASELPDVLKARALRSTVTGNFADARRKLDGVLQKAPADAAALVYLGWTELGAGDAAAADKAFSRALAAEATRPAALYGDGVAKERLGNVKAANDLYTRTLARSPMHFGAAVGAARTGKKPDEALADVSALIDKRASSVAPKELGDAWATAGLLAANAGRRDEAEDRLKRALGLDPDNAIARVALANVQCDLKHCADAVEPMKKLVAAQPSNLEARLALVRALVETNEPKQAADMLAPAAKAAPKSASVLYWQARVMLAQAKPDREGALAKLKDAIAADPKLLPAYVAESTTFAALEKPDDAVAALQAAQQQASDDPELMTQLGEAYLALGRAADAEARFRAALDKKPDMNAARIDLGTALEAEGKLDDARAQYDQIANQDAKYPGVLEKQARLAVKQNRKADAAKLFDEALKQGVPTQSLRLAAASLFLDPAIGRADDARKLAESVVNEDDRSAAAHLMLARVQLESGHADEALPEARRAATLSDMPEAHLALARSLEAINKLDQAISEYNLARRPPVEGEAQLGRARILVRMGATKDALAELTALAKNPKLRAEALLLEGDCYADLQQVDRARHAYEDAAKANPQSGDAAFKLGRAFHDAQRRHEAIAMLERAVKLGGEKAPYTADAYLILGDAHREGHENDAAVRAYKKYLDLAPTDAPARAEVQKHISQLEGG